MIAPRYVPKSLNGRVANLRNSLWRGLARFLLRIRVRPSDALPAHAKYPRPVPPGKARSRFGESRVRRGLDSINHSISESIFHRRMTEAKKSFHTRLQYVAEYRRKFTHPGQIHPVSVTCQLYRLSYLPAGGLCLVFSGRLTWADGAS